MNESIRKRALRAAAKVALSFTVMGCGTVVIEKVPLPAQDDPVEKPSEQPSSDGQPRLKNPTVLGLAETSDELLCHAPTAAEDVPLDDDELVACCRAELGPQLSLALDDQQVWNDFATAAAEDAGTQACCTVLVVNNDADAQSTGNVDFETAWLLQPCCQSIDVPVGPTCTPWGPPMPPSMRRPLFDLNALLPEAVA